MTSKKSRFILVDGLRGVAAFWVLLFHLYEGGHIENLAQTLPKFIFFFVFECGHLGVPIFFVLSGFVIAHSLKNAEVNFTFFWKFTLKRSIRLDPPYWVSILLFLSFAAISAYVKHENFEMPSFGNLLSHLFYLQIYLGYSNINTIYWTLCYEIQFYLFFCAMIGLSLYLKNKLKGDYAEQFFGVAMSILALLWGCGIVQGSLIRGLFIDRWYGFFLGVLAYWAWITPSKKIMFFLVSIPIGLSSAFTSHSFALTCAGTAFLLYFAGAYGKIYSWLSNKTIQFLGAISYSLYLIHNPITGATSFLVYKVVPKTFIGEVIAASIIILVCSLVARIFWWLVEKPSTRISQKIILKKNKSNAVGTCNS